MFLKSNTSKKKQNTDPIIWRGHEVTRIEAFSDAVFAFAITLLIVALEVPKTYKELMESMAFFIPFAICFIILFMIWYAQNMFFRRYGLHDFYTLVLNGILLFVVLFFVYPLKFLFGGLFSGSFNVNGVQEASNLFYIYSGGFMAIYFLIGLMYYNALQNKESLKLTAIESFETKSHMFSYFAISGVAVSSIILAYMGGGYIGLAGFIYAFIGPLLTILYSIRNKKKQKLFPNAIENKAVPIDDTNSASNKIMDDHLA